MTNPSKSSGAPPASSGSQCRSEFAQAGSGARTNCLSSMPRPARGRRCSFEDGDELRDDGSGSLRRRVAEPPGPCRSRAGEERTNKRGELMRRSIVVVGVLALANAAHALVDSSGLTAALTARKTTMEATDPRRKPLDKALTVIAQTSTDA